MKSDLRRVDGIAFTDRGSGPPVVLLHPIGLDSTFWEPVARPLAHDFRVIAIDLRGHGASRPAGADIQLADLADDVAAVTDAAVGETCALVGLSLGAMVALTLATRSPDRAWALVLADTHFKVQPSTADFFERRARLAESEGMSAVAEQSLRRWFSARGARECHGVLEEIRRSLLAADPTSHARIWRALARLDVAGDLHRLVMPTLVINGAEDVATTPEDGRRLASLLPRGGYSEIAGAGHMSAAERPDEFALRTIEFLNAARP